MNIIQWTRKPPLGAKAEYKKEDYNVVEYFMVEYYKVEPITIMK